MPHHWTMAENIAALYLARCYGNKGYKGDLKAKELVAHGITPASLHMALGNYLSLYNRGGLTNTSKAQRQVFLSYGGLSADELRGIAIKALGGTTVGKPVPLVKGKYALPDFLASIVSQKAYIRWLQRKATAHAKRDRKRGNAKVTNEAYKIAIHDAACTSSGRDAYTGEVLDWALISKYDNDSSKAGPRNYKAGFAMLPTVDHVGDGKGAPEFRICSWRTNSAKSDLSLSEFISLCRKVVSHSQ